MPAQTPEVLLAVLVVSLVSLVGALFLALRKDKLKGMLPFLVALAAGALLGDTFLHLLPHATAHSGGFTPTIAWGVLGGLLGFLLIEGTLHWHHHGEDVHDHAPGGIHSFGWMNLLGDFVHNILDGMLIAGAWLVGPEAGVATTIAVLLHEIPQEFGDFGVLLHAGFTPRRALLLNFATACSAFLGAIVVLLMHEALHVEEVLVPIAAGGFIYIACADLIPELRRLSGMRLVKSGLALAVGLLLMVAVHEIMPHEHGHGHAHEGHGHSHSHDEDR
ncbi:MAG: ZIP family metal transporter [Planctomycetota bacterium]|nr:ZIP family metal transporter [Planctomycetota bacterium]